MTTIQTDLTGRRAIGHSPYRNPKFNGLFGIIIRASRVELTEKLREAVARKIGRVRQYAPRAFRARVHFDREHMKAAVDQYRVTVRYEIPGNDLIAEHRAPEPMAALDLVAEKIERRLRKRKTARLARSVGSKARASRIADFCASHEPSALRS
jgi:ribosomal subunit interface protein